jgi:hypothetical protein
MKRRLTCCCYGEGAGRWEQHWNRDTGYGICVPCIAWLRAGPKPRATEAEIADLYGREGVNWGAQQ